MTDALVAWLFERTPTVIKGDRLSEFYQAISPRNVFMKNLPRESVLLDVGAGNGSTAILRDWPFFARPDLRLFGLSLQMEPGLARYDEVRIGNFEQGFPAFSVRQFDAIICSHFIEHLQDYRRFLKWASDSLRIGGSIYIEWPHAVSESVTPRNELARHGFETSTTNFRDDRTHVCPWPMSDMVADIEKVGFEVLTSGRIVFPFLAEQLRNGGIDENDPVKLTFAIWAHTGWAQYVVARKSAPTSTA